MVLGQLKMGEHQAKCRALSFARANIWSMYIVQVSAYWWRAYQAQLMQDYWRSLQSLKFYLSIHCRHRHDPHGNANSFISMKSQGHRCPIAILISISWSIELIVNMQGGLNLSAKGFLSTSSVIMTTCRFRRAWWRASLVGGRNKRHLLLFK